MTYGYFASPARSEPITASRSLSSGYDGGKHFAHIAPRPKPTLSVPSSFPTNRTYSKDQPALVGLGLGLALPSTLVTRLRPEPPHARRQAQLGLGMPFIPVPMRSARRRVAASYTPASHARGPALRIDTANIHRRARDGGSHPAIMLTLADAFNSDREGDDFGNGDSDEGVPRYTFLPPGLSSPVPWPSSPVSPTSPSERPMTFRRLASPGIRAPGDATPPGAPLSPSISRVGTHHHFPGLDHSAGGIADEEGMPMVAHTRTVRPPGAPRLPSVDRFEYDPLYH
ncbi:hypothetical protein BD414DRAFT_526940 [Trametes punicea]|nr:hypothetical protein BD414DRAFT_526940 [Trametes punicea]